MQFVVVDDGSFDGTADVVTPLAGIDYVRSGRNEGFVRACNRGAAIARGRYVCFLNNDTVVRGGWLEHLVTTAEGDPTIGAVGAKLLLSGQAQLRDPGNILWRDATGWNVGHAENPDDPRYNFLREADYVSGAALLVRRDLFERLGGFSEAYRPAYYEDADLCFGVRSLGYRVVYQPRAEVIHYEGVTSGDEHAGREAIPRDQPAEVSGKVGDATQFAAWKTITRTYAGVAARHAGQDDAHRRFVRADVRPRSPARNESSASSRCCARAGYRVVFLPDNYAPLQPYTSELQQMGVEVLHHIDGGKTQQEALDDVLPLIDLAWISRPDLLSQVRAGDSRQRPRARRVRHGRPQSRSHAPGKRSCSVRMPAPGAKRCRWSSIARVTPT